jgi:hypothetical protein
MPVVFIEEHGAIALTGCDSVAALEHDERRSIKTTQSFFIENPYRS